MPMVAARLLLVAVHALLHDRPFAVVGHEEPMEVEIEAVLDGGAVDFGDQAACAGELGAVESDAFAEQRAIHPASSANAGLGRRRHGCQVHPKAAQARV